MIDFSKQAMVLAAGLGTRLRPLTLDTPKPLLSISEGICCLGLALEHLHRQKMDRIVVNTYYLAEQITLFVKQNYPAVHLSHECEPLETGGGVLNALPHFDLTHPLLIVNSDTYIEDRVAVDLGVQMLTAFDPSREDILLAVSQKSWAIGHEETNLGQFEGEHKSRASIEGASIKGDYDFKNDPKENRRLAYRPNGKSAEFVFVSHRVVMPSFIKA